jgi:hypothetical protein
LTPRWLRRRSETPSPAAKIEPQQSPADGGRPESERGPKLLLERLDEDGDGTEILAALGRRDEVSPTGESGREFQVIVDNAVFPDEAVVRLASVLDGIDEDWVRHLRWPKAQA